MLFKGLSFLVVLFSCSLLLAAAPAPKNGPSSTELMVVATKNDGSHPPQGFSATQNAAKDQKQLSTSGSRSKQPLPVKATPGAAAGINRTRNAITTQQEALKKLKENNRTLAEEFNESGSCIIS